MLGFVSLLFSLDIQFLYILPALANSSYSSSSSSSSFLFFGLVGAYALILAKAI